MSLEEDLRRTLGRTPAPSGFAERVLARVEQRDVRPLLDGRPRRLDAGRYLAAAAAIVIVAWGGVHYERQARDAAEAARVQHEIRLALQITGEKLAMVQRKLQEPDR